MLPTILIHFLSCVLPFYISITLRPPPPPPPLPLLILSSPPLFTLHSSAYSFLPVVFFLFPLQYPLPSRPSLFLDYLQVPIIFSPPPPSLSLLSLSLRRSLSILSLYLFLRLPRLTILSTLLTIFHLLLVYFTLSFNKKQQITRTTYLCCSTRL